MVQSFVLTKKAEENKIKGY